MNPGGSDGLLKRVNLLYISLAGLVVMVAFSLYANSYVFQSDSDRGRVLGEDDTINQDPNSGLGNVLLPPTIISPALNTTIRGTQEIGVRFDGLINKTELKDEVEIRFIYMTAPIKYTGRFMIPVSDIPTYNSIYTNQLYGKVPLDTIPLANGPWNIKVCRQSLLGTGEWACSDYQRFRVRNTLSLYGPRDNEKVAGQVLFMAKPTGHIEYMLFYVNQTAGGDPTIADYMSVNNPDNNGWYRYILDTTKTALTEDLSHTVNVEYLPIGQTHYGPRLKTSASIIINNVNDDGTPNDQSAGDNTTDGSTGDPTTDGSISDDETPATGNDQPTINEGSINVDFPRQNAQYFSIDRVEGSVDKQRQVSIQIDNASTVAADLRESSDGRNRFIYSLPYVLPPGRHIIELTEYDYSGQITGKGFINFILLLPKIELANIPTTISGIVTLNVGVLGGVGNIELNAISAGNQNYYLGRATRTNIPEIWSLTYDTKNIKDGSYQLYANFTDLDGQAFESDKKTVTVNNGSPPTDGSGQPAQDLSDVIVSLRQQGVDAENIDSLEEIESIIKNQSKPRTIEDTVDESLGPRQGGELVPDKLKVYDVDNLQLPTIEKPYVVLRGVGPPNSIVTLYIYSNPLVVTTKTDDDGNWTYIVDKPLEEGRHEVYVTITDDTGKVTEKGNPLAFFISEAIAISEEDFLRADVDVSSDNNLLTLYIILAISIVVIIILAIFYFSYNRRQNKPTISGS
ncbi:Ig-like domain-containing protein [Patescibacteria group bacterium]